MAIVLKKATRKQGKVRMAIDGASGSGKTWTALAVATHLDTEKKGIAVIDTENGSASKYAKTERHGGFEFMVPTKENGQPLFSGKYDPEQLISTIEELGKAGVGVIIIDSLFHFWKGEGGFLWLIDKEVKEMKVRGQKPDSFAAWKKYDPLYLKLITAIQTSPAHVICTIRSKQDHDKVMNDKTGKLEIKKVGLAPEFREGFDYEMDCYGSMREGENSSEHVYVVTKSRVGLDGKYFINPGKELADTLIDILTDGEVAAPVPAPAPTPVANEFANVVALINSANDANELDDARNTGLAAYKEGRITKEQANELAPIIKARKAQIEANGAAA